jgi:hypothetical protein
LGRVVTWCHTASSRRERLQTAQGLELVNHLHALYTRAFVGGWPRIPLCEKWAGTGDAKRVNALVSASADSALRPRADAAAARAATRLKLRRIRGGWLERV